MPRTPARLDHALLAAHRPGALVAVGLGLPAGLPARRPRGFALFAAEQVSTSPGGRLPPPAPGVALVQVRGVLEQRASWYSCGESDGYDAIEERFASAIFDPGVGSVVLDADSPGGDDPGLEQLIQRMRAMKAATGKPVLGYVDELAASACCWLLAGACDRIMLPRSGRIGSIAQVVIYQSEARAEASAGRDTYVARGLPGKMVPNSLEPLDELGKARLDAHALAGTERFIEQMVAFRGLSAATIRAWNGSIFTGAAAVAAGLADGVGTLEETISLAAMLANQEAR